MKPTRAEKGSPCPLCGREKWPCQFNLGDRGELVECGSYKGESVPGWRFIRMDGSGCGLYAVVDPAAPGPRSPRPAARLNDEPASPTIDVAAEHARALAAMTDERRDALAAELKLPSDAMDAIRGGVGWNPDAFGFDDDGNPLPRGAWTTPEYDGAGRMIGHGWRFRGGTKRGPKDGKRGLTLPVDLEAAGPVLLVEGMSDVAACSLMGLCAVGRSSNRNDAGKMIELLANRPVILMGENDRHLNKAGEMIWPGKEGVDAIQPKLEKAWARPVWAAFPPDAAKDPRRWLLDHNIDLSDRAAVLEAGRRFMAAIRSTLEPVKLRAEPINGRVRVKLGAWTVNSADAVFPDKIDIGNSRSREQFAAAVAARLPGVNPVALADEIARLKPAEPDAPDGGDEREPTTKRLIAIALSRAELWHAPGAEPETFASIGMPADATGPERTEHWPLKSSRFKSWLFMAFFDEHGNGANSQAVADAVATLTGHAMRGPEYRSAVRVAGADGAIWLDLADAVWRVIRVDRDGWRAMPGESCPIRFTRRRGMLPLPVPTEGGSVAELWRLVNVPDPASRALLLGFLAAAMRPGSIYPIIVINGGQGSAKSTLCRYIRALIDPSSAPLRSPPKDEGDLAITTRNSWMPAYDNLSGLPPWLADALCRVSTGGGLSTRELYTNDGEFILDATRPVIINGIADLTARSDLADRAIILNLPPIPPDARRDPDEIDAEFEAARPRIIGALLTAISTALRNLPGVKLDRLPRMAGVARWAVAASPALGLADGEFLSVYENNRSDAAADAVSDSIIGPPIFELMANRTEWRGTASDLLAELRSRVDDETARRREWPRGPRGLAAVLKRLAPALSATGFTIENFREHGGNRSRLIQIRHEGPEVGRLPGDHGTIDGADRPIENTEENSDPGDWDGRDDLLPDPPADAVFQNLIPTTLPRFPGD